MQRVLADCVQEDAFLLHPVCCSSAGVDIDPTAECLARLAQDSFRRKFTLRDRELAYLQMWGIDKVMKDARDLILRRVAPADPKNDGRQTPWRNHPVFVAQHATATCCRGCVAKWHGIDKGHAFTDAELERVLSVIRAWLVKFV